MLSSAYDGNKRGKQGPGPIRFFATAHGGAGAAAGALPPGKECDSIDIARFFWISMIDRAGRRLSAPIPLFFPLSTTLPPMTATTRIATI